MFDIYQTVTDQIIKAMETASAESWQKPWIGGGIGGRPVNAISGKAYRGINVPMLWLAGRERQEWATYKQWAESGCQVRKGEKASHIIVWKEWTPKAAGGGSGALPGEIASDDGKRLFARGYAVFNAEQVDGFQAPADEKKPDAPKFEPLAAAESFVAACGADIRHGGGRAYYAPGKGRDWIQMPARESFVGTETSSAGESYYGTLLHELTHWSGAETRCNRDFGNRFGSNSYAFEELVAELGAAFLCADLRITAEPRPDHAQYLNSWLSVLKGDKKAIFTAASKAEQAATFLKLLQKPAEPLAIAA